MTDEPKLLQVYSLDVWGNEDDGFEVNAEYRTGITLLKDMSDDYYYRQIREYYPNIGNFEIQWANEDWACLYCRKTGKPLLQLRGDL